jgi:undecaprenyl-diphosphatase
VKMNMTTDRPPRVERNPSLFVGFVTETWDIFRSEWRQLPRAAIGIWIAILILGFGLSAWVAATVTRFAKEAAPHWLDAWDLKAIRWIENEFFLSFTDAIIAESPGNLAYLIPLTLAAMIIAIRMHRPLCGLTIALSYILQRPLILFGWKLWDRARPKLIAEGLAAPDMHSFPSGHIALAMSVYGLLAFLWIRSTQSWIERGIVCIFTVFLVAVVGIARSRLGTHWPSDLIGGTIVGLVWLATVIVALTFAERRGGR